MKSGFRICFFFILFPLFGHTQQKDLWQWSTLSFEKKISQKISLAADEEFRLFHSITQINLLYTNIGGSYKLSKFFKFSLVYRSLQKRRDDGSYSFRHRVYVDLLSKCKVSKFLLSYRARFQSQVRDIHSSSDGSVPENYWRSKFDIKLDLKKKIIPYVAAEFRFQFANPRLREANFSFNRGRYYLGFDYSLSRISTLGFYYMLQWEYNINDPERDSVLGIQYGLSL